MKWIIVGPKSGLDWTKGQRLLGRCIKEMKEDWRRKCCLLLEAISIKLKFNPALSKWKKKKSLLLAHFTKMIPFNFLKNKILNLSEDITGSYIATPLVGGGFRIFRLGFFVMRLGNMWMGVWIECGQEMGFMDYCFAWFGSRDGASEKTLGILEGCLFVLCNYKRLYADIWVMREYVKRVLEC